MTPYKCSQHPPKFFCDECSPPSEREKDIAAGLTEWMPKPPNVKVPKWTRSEDLSICDVGPWKLRVTKETDEDDGKVYWEVDVTGPGAPEHLQYFDFEPHSTCEDAEYDAVIKVSSIAGILEPLQRYL